MGTTRSTFISVVEEARRTAYNSYTPEREVVVEEREDDDAYMRASLEARGDCGGSHTGTPTPRGPMTRSAPGRGLLAPRHRATAPEASSVFTAYGVKKKASELRQELART